MPRSLWKTLLALACMVAALAFAACGGDDEEEGGDAGAPVTQEEGDGGGAANITEELFAGSPTGLAIHDRVAEVLLQNHR